MNIKYLDPMAGINRLAINDELFYRMCDLARDLDVRFERKNIGNIICRMFRQAHPNTFFYTEVNPTHPRGYYMAENLLDELVHFSGSHHEEALALLAKEKGRVPSKKPARAAKVKKAAINGPRLVAEMIAYTTVAYDQYEIGYFLRDNTLWFKVADIARILRPETLLHSVAANSARTAGVKVLAVRHPKHGRRGSYFVQLRDFSKICEFCHVSGRTVVAKKLHAYLQTLVGDAPVIETEVTGNPASIEELRAMNAKLLEAMNAMMAFIAKTEGSAKVGA